MLAVRCSLIGSVKQVSVFNYCREPIHLDHVYQKTSKRQENNVPQSLGPFICCWTQLLQSCCQSLRQQPNFLSLLVPLCQALRAAGAITCQHPDGQGESSWSWRQEPICWISRLRRACQAALDGTTGSNCISCAGLMDADCQRFPKHK